ncbi:MAG: cell division protein ZapA [Alphaproteobacteria bacterium]|nr:cell division protein ZapA [Alphaproteobacteria bacterium]
MPHLDVSVNGRIYSLTCDAGQEEHLRELAAHLDRKVMALSESVGQIGDARLLLMAGLLTTEEYLAAVQRLEGQAQATVDLARSEEIAVEALEAATKRVEDIAARLGAA